MPQRANLKSRNPNRRKPGRPKGTGGRARELLPEEVKRIIRCSVGQRNEHRNRTLFLLGLGSGMRIGEIVGLTVGDVYPYGDVLPSITLEKHSTKSGKSREVYLSGQARKELQDWLENHHPQRFRDPDFFLEAPLFPSNRRGWTEHLSSTTGNRAIKTMFERAGISGASSHSMRRSHGCALLESGASLPLIQEQFGHSSLQVTGRYLGVRATQKAKVLDKLKF